MRANPFSLLALSFLLALTTRAQTNPIAVTLPATNVVAVEGIAGGTLQGTVNPGGTNTTTWFEWGVRLNYGNTTPPFAAGDGTNPAPKSATLSNLNAGWRYHYRLVASNSLGVARGADRVCWAPAIALNGANPLTNECHTRYMEPARVKATPVAIAAGGSYHLALRPDGSIISWGENSQDFIGWVFSGPPSSASNVVGIACNIAQGLAVRADGVVLGWGTNYFVPASMTNAVAVAAGAGTYPEPISPQVNGFSLALTTSGTVVMWSFNFGPTNLVTNVVAIAAGGVQKAWLYADGTVGPDAPAGLSNVIAIACGGFHSLGLQADGKVVSWGTNNTYGQTNVPVQATNVVAIGAGQWHSLAVRADGSVIGWGRNNLGQIDIPLSVTNAIAVAGGLSNSVALLADGRIIGWGDNSRGQISIPADFIAAGMAAGPYNALAVTTNGTVVTWGRKRVGPFTPLVPPSTATNIVAVAAGENHNVALRSDGNVIAWGYNNYGQANVPAYVTNVVGIAAGGTHNTALKADGTAVVWGLSAYTLSDSNIVGVAQGSDQVVWVNADGTTGGGAPAATDAIKVASTGAHSLTLKSDGTVLGTGANGNGQITIPANATNVVSIAAGRGANLGFSLAARGDGSVIGWGFNGRGQTTIPSRATRILSVVASAHVSGTTDIYSLALRDDGTVIGWGDSNYGQTMIPSSPSTLQMNVEVSGSVNTNVPGGYALTYSVTNAEGAISTATRTVVIADTRPPRVTLLGANPFMLEVGSPFVDAGATASDLCAGDLTGSLLTIGSVNTNVPGTYLVNYSVTDANGFTGSTNRTVLVVTRPSLVVPTQAGDGSFQFTFTNTPGAQFNVLTATNVSLPLDQWTLLGPVTEAPPGEFHFTDASATNEARFYRVKGL